LAPLLPFRNWGDYIEWLDSQPQLQRATTDHRDLRRVNFVKLAWPKFTDKTEFILEFCF
jgi:hypothetical protein